jgi:host factor-I protein
MPFRSALTSATLKNTKSPPPETTNQEAEYLKELGEKQKPVSIKLMDGEIVHGWIEYYDQNMVRLTREGAPNLFIFKHDIVYIAEDTGRRATGGTGSRRPESGFKGQASGRSSQETSRSRARGSSAELHAENPALPRPSEDTNDDGK